jgi:HemY protein
MFRLLGLLIGLVLVIGAAVMAANHRGTVGIDWEGWHVDTSLAALCLVAVGVGLAVWGVWTLVAAIFGSPFSLRRRYREKQRREGYKALTLGMVAIAAGDGTEAKRHAKRARSLTNEVPLTLLLSAQAAQLDGDEQAAKRYFENMIDQPETEFLGLRGLFSIALKRGDQDEALALAERAEARKPDAPWVLAALVELYERKGDWTALRRVLASARPSESLDAPSLARKRTLTALAAADLAEREGNLDEALSEATKALDASPNFVPALAAQARLLIVRGEHAKAAKTIERAWPAAAHPDLARLYADTMLGNPALDQVKRFEKLAKLAPGAAASHLALADSARAAKLWGEARRHFQQAADLDPAVRATAYRGLAEL